MTDEEIVTVCEEWRPLGDLYQAAYGGDPKGPVKLNALVQTPGFVGDFLLDRTMTPALDTFDAEFRGGCFRSIDPCCGTGHLLLQMLGRLVQHSHRLFPKDGGEVHVRRALACVHGVDCDPIAVVLAKLRLLRAAVRLSGRDSLPREPFPLKVCWADSLLDPGQALQPYAVLDELRWLRKVCEAKGWDWRAEAKAQGRQVADL